jgi:hypothetical protein
VPAASRRCGPPSTSRYCGLNQSFIKIGASFFGGTGAGANSAGRGRGSGVDDGVWRCRGESVSPKWFNQAAIADSGDGASGGAAGVAWAWAEAKANSKKDRENATVFSAVIWIIFAPTLPSVVYGRLTGNRAMLRRNPRPPSV